jgi:hypothetical protein
MAVQLQLRRGTASQWTAANTLLAQGELGLEIDTGKLKIGDGTTTWTSLAYYSAGSDAVTSVNGHTGTVVLTAADVGAIATETDPVYTASSWYSTTNNATNWDTAYTDRNKWDGGATGLVAATGRTSLGLGTAATTNSTDYATAAQGTKADTAYGWGNHASAGYLTSGTIGVTVQGYNASTVIDASYVHTDNNYTTTEKSKLAGIAAGAEVNVNADWTAVSGDAQILNKPSLATVATSGAYSDLSGTPTLPSGSIVGTTDTQTLTNKDIVERVVSIADGTSITINADTTDIATQANTQSAGTLTINAPTGTPVNGQKITLRLQSTNVQTFSWNGVFAGSTDLALPTASTGSGKYDYIGFIYNSTASKWQLLAKVFGF